MTAVQDGRVRKAVAKKVPAKRVPVKKAVTVTVPLAKAVAAVPEFALALTEMAKELAAQRLRTDEAESKLADQELLQSVVDGLRADILEVNRVLNWYGGTRGWCSDYERLQRLTNQRLTQCKMLRRPGFGEGYSDHPELKVDEKWKSLDW